MTRRYNSFQWTFVTMIAIIYGIVNCLMSSCNSSPQALRTSMVEHSIALRNIVYDSLYSANPINRHSTRLILDLDYGKYNGRYKWIRIAGYKKVTLQYTGKRYLDYYSAVIDKETIWMKSNREWNQTYCGIACGFGGDIVYSLRYRDSVHVSLHLLCPKEQVIEIYDSIKFAIQFFDTTGADTVFHCRFSTKDVKW